MSEVAGLNDKVHDQVLLRLRKIRREFPTGDTQIAVLKDVDLDIHAGEMVAIVGQSGSGKSTLLNILGCLDQASSGSYQVDGRETALLDFGELAHLRREHFGFIFQRYHLLPDLTAQANVEMPAIYAGSSSTQRSLRASQLLQRLGLAQRSDFTPGKLSGGQQQRVSIARALVNGGMVILADEPTGALDSASGAEVMRILQELHAEGHTIVLVTHDMQVAEHAQRVIKIHDGEIVSDQAIKTTKNSTIIAQNSALDSQSHVHEKDEKITHISAVAARFRESFKMALLALNAHRMRSFLTMLGIIIGIASVVTVVALGEGAQRKILENIASIGTNTIYVSPGTGLEDRRAWRTHTLVEADAVAISQQAYVDSVTPSLGNTSSVRYSNKQASGVINGVGEQFFQVSGMKLAHGRTFSQQNVLYRQQVVVIDENTRKIFFENENPLGKTILFDNVPAQIIGVLDADDLQMGAPSKNVSVYMPYTTVMSRITGQSHLNSIIVRIRDDASSQAAEAGLTDLLQRRHGRKDFYLTNTDTIRKLIASSTQTFTLLITSIAIISLLVGGVGVMNIMLVSVTERTGEIGVRMAVGARQSDIQQQFLIEAVLVCLLGGLLGLMLALSFGYVFNRNVSAIQLVFSSNAMMAAVVCSSLIGIVFGYVPARNAARLNPVDALSRN